MCTWSWWPPQACGAVIDWGDVPTWLAGVFAAIAAFYALRAFRKEQERDRKEQERDREAAQERQELAKEKMRVQAQRVSVSRDTKRGFVVKNRSDEPITYATVYLDNQTGTAVAMDQVRAIAPDESAFVPLYTQNKWYMREKPGIHGHMEPDEWNRFPPGVRFTDAADHHWDRRPDGKLILDERYWLEEI